MLIATCGGETIIFLHRTILKIRSFDRGSMGLTKRKFEDENESTKRATRRTNRFVGKVNEKVMWGKNRQQRRTRITVAATTERAR